ncbi:MAG TPA: hypothetical protein VNS12_00245 [Pelagibacterium sp.]|uniref:hypothetical protein n=1 Tax=Pelagibacterium sp. TaxID=1967288 RepID=UPI002B598808|nr:hypothetical protein [Pelagibacterium sp.]HWJ86485.1 hypothetical protein [Pelagibacterium sp.]
MEAYLWLFAVLGGAIILGIALAVGANRSSHATRRQQDAGERGARELYHKEQNDH